MTAEWITPPQAARELRCRESKVAAWIKSGRLAAVNVSDGHRPRYRIRRSDLDAFLATLAVVPAIKPARRNRPRRETSFVEYV